MNQRFIYNSSLTIPIVGSAIIVEYRICNKFVSAILNAVQNLPENWMLQIFHSEFNSHFISHHPKLELHIISGKIALTLVPEEFGGREENPYRENEMKNFYTRLLLSNWFWENVLMENTLVFQMDSRFCSNSPRKLEEFTHYAYIGAPWWNKGCWGEIVGVGQGGFSFRKKSVMLTVISLRDELRQKIKEDESLKDCDGIDVAEDRVFSFGVYYLAHHLKKPNVLYPDKETAGKFVLEVLPRDESVAYLPSYGVHVGGNTRENFYHWCPEVKDCQSPCERLDNYEAEWGKNRN